MAIDDPVLNCILGVCCPPQSDRQHRALVKFLIEKGVDEDAAYKAASAIQAEFDLAPHGTLRPLKDAIARVARGPNYKE